MFVINLDLGMEVAFNDSNHPFYQVFQALYDIVCTVFQEAVLLWYGPCMSVVNLIE